MVYYFILSKSPYGDHNGVRLYARLKLFSPYYIPTCPCDLGRDPNWEIRQVVSQLEPGTLPTWIIQTTPESIKGQGGVQLWNMDFICRDNFSSRIRREDTAEVNFVEFVSERTAAKVLEKKRRRREGEDEPTPPEIVGDTFLKD